MGQARSGTRVENLEAKYRGSATTDVWRGKRRLKRLMGLITCMYDISGIPGLFVQRLNDYTEHDIWNGGDLCPSRS